MYKKILAIILTMAMIVPICSINNNPVRVEAVIEKTTSFEENPDNIYEGKYGNFQWKVDKDTQTLYITGTGAFQYDKNWRKQYSNAERETKFGYNGPWRLSNHLIKNLVLSEGITSAEMGYGQFEAYYDCTYTSIQLPDSLKSITVAKKKGCYNLLSSESIRVGKNLKKGLEKFDFLYTKDIQLPAENKNYIKKNNLVYSKSKKTLYKYLGNKATVKISKYVKTIMPGAFYGTKVKNIKLPVGLKKIGTKAFYNTKIKSIVIPKNAKFSIYAFPHKTKVKYKKSFKKIKPVLAYGDVSWNKIINAEGYQFQMERFKDDLSGKTEKSKKFVRKTKVEYNDMDIAYRIRGYKTVKGKKVYTRWSSWVGNLWEGD